MFESLPLSPSLGEEDLGGDVWPEGCRPIDRISALEDKYVDFIGVHAPTRPGKSLWAWSREVWHLQSNTVLCSRQIERGGGSMLILRLSRSWNHSVCERIISIVLMCSKCVFLKSDVTFSFARENMHDRWTAILTALLIIAARRFLKNTVVCVFMQLSINCSVASWILNEKKKKEEGALHRAFK